MPVVFQRLYDNLQGCARWLHLALDNIEGVAGSSSNERSGVCLPRTKISRPSMTESSLLQNILEMGETDEPPGNLAEMYRSLLAIGERLKQGILTAIKKDLAEKEKRAKDGTETSDEEDEGEEEAEEEEEHEEEDEEDDEGSDEDTKKSSKRNHVKGLYFALLDVFFNLPILWFLQYLKNVLPKFCGEIDNAIQLWITRLNFFTSAKSWQNFGRTLLAVIDVLAMRELRKLNHVTASKMLSFGIYSSYDFALWRELLIQ